MMFYFIIIFCLFPYKIIKLKMNVFCSENSGYKNENILSFIYFSFCDIYCGLNSFHSYGSKFKMMFSIFQTWGIIFRPKYDWMNSANTRLKGKCLETYEIKRNVSRTFFFTAMQMNWTLFSFVHCFVFFKTIPSSPNIENTLPTADFLTLFHYSPFLH